MVKRNKFAGMRALVTGASSGIGNAVARLFLQSGMRVVISGRNENKLMTLAGEFKEAVIEPADLTDSNQTIRLALNSLKHFAGLDVLVNNAGIGINRNVIQMDLSEFDLTLNLNLRAPFILSKIIGAHMAESGGGHIINIGSGASYTPIAGYAAYCASKYGLLGFSESLALELRQKNIKVSIVMPGSVATAFGGGTPEQRLKSRPGILLPEDVAQAVMFLLDQPAHAWTSQVNLRPLNPDKKWS